MAERIQGRSRRHIPVSIKAAAILALAPAALWAACGGGGNDGEVKDTATGTPFGTPANSGGSGESPTAVSSTVKPPEATPTKTATATETVTPTPPEVVLTPEELTSYVDSAMDSLPKSPKTDAARENIRAAYETLQYVLANDPRVDPISPVNLYGSTAQIIADLACQNPNNDAVGKTWLEIRRYVKNYTAEREANGTFSLETTNQVQRLFFTPPPDCPHPLLAK